VEILFLLVGLVFLAFGVAIVLFEARSRRGAWAVPAEVIGFSTGKGVGSGAPSYHPVAEYAGMDGRKRYLEGSVGSSSPLGAVGDAVTVLVQPDDPEKAVLKSSLTYVIGAALALMGLASCIVFFAVFRATTFSIVGAVGVVTWTAYKFRGSIRERPMSPARILLPTGRATRSESFTTPIIRATPGSTEAGGTRRCRSSSAAPVCSFASSASGSSSDGRPLLHALPVDRVAEDSPVLVRATAALEVVGLRTRCLARRGAFTEATHVAAGATERVGGAVAKKLADLVRMVQAAAGLREGDPGGGRVCAAYHVDGTGLRVRALLAGRRRALPGGDAAPSTFL